jgi:hypothetical protein
MQRASLVLATLFNHGWKQQQRIHIFNLLFHISGCSFDLCELIHVEEAEYKLQAKG